MPDLITQAGKARLEEQIRSLKKELERTIEERAKAAAEGDLRENSAYIFMSERSEVLLSQIKELESDLNNSVVRSCPSDTSSVAFGHKVKVFFQNDKREFELTLVGKNDSSLKPGWVSLESPLGQAILDKKMNDTVEVNGQPVTILSIAPGDI